MASYDKWDREPDYMDRFTGIRSDRYSDLKLHCELSFRDSCGKVYSGDRFRIPAATAGTWEIEIINEGRRLKRDSRVGISLYNGSFAHETQQTNPAGKDYITLENSGNAEIRLSEKIPGFSKVCRMYIMRGSFKKGDKIKIRIGDTRRGGTGSNTYWTAGKSYMFIEACEAGGEMLPVVGTPFEFEVTAREDKAYLRILGPTVSKPGEPQRIHIGAFDRCGNLIKDFSKKIMIEDKELEMTGGFGILEGVVFQKTGTYRLKASIKGEKAVFMSNPMIVKEDPEHHIYWGDLHAHGWGDSSMHLMHVNNDKTSPLSRHEQARDIGRMDFSAPGPMSYPRTDRTAIWDEYKAACRQTDEEGRYVPFLAYEAHPQPEGDRQVVFKNIDEPVPVDYRIPMSEVEKLYRDRKDVMTEVHIGGRIPRWDEYLPEDEKFIEAISAFGNAEWLLQEALDRGYRPAVLGASDLHYGLMGGPRTIEESRGRFGKYLNKRDSAYGTGPVTAVCAKKLERDTLWTAMHERRTYATTDQRIYLEFNVNGVSYGGETGEAPEYEIEINVAGTDEIESISLVSGKYTVRSSKPGKMDFSEKAILQASELPGDFIYMKVLQRDGGFAICTPVYIKRMQEPWNSGEVFSKNPDQAKEHLKDLLKYIETEEDPEKFSDISPVGIIDEKITRCALFHGLFIGRPVNIRWYYEYEIPRFRLDWGRVNTGVKNDERIYSPL